MSVCVCVQMTIQYATTHLTESREFVCVRGGLCGKAGYKSAGVNGSVCMD